MRPNYSQNLPGVAYTGESSSPGSHTLSPGYHTALSQYSRGMRPQGVTHDPGESITICPFLKTVKQAFKGIEAQK